MAERKKFGEWLKGKNRQEHLENISFVILVLAAFLVMSGIGLGSFVYGTVLLAMFGAFLILVGIIVYIISQFLEVKK
jgi:CHASE2 domain-containing sensor protein